MAKKTERHGGGAYIAAAFAANIAKSEFKRGGAGTQSKIARFFKQTTPPPPPIF
jgi:hypothetical protein